MEGFADQTETTFIMAVSQLADDMSDLWFNKCVKKAFSYLVTPAD